MFYSFTNNPKVPSLNFTLANIQDSNNFSQINGATGKRDQVLSFIESISSKTSKDISGEEIKNAIQNLSCSIDLVNNY